MSSHNGPSLLSPLSRVTFDLLTLPDQQNHSNSPFSFSRRFSSKSRILFSKRCTRSDSVKLSFSVTVFSSSRIFLSRNLIRSFSKLKVRDVLESSDTECECDDVWGTDERSPMLLPNSTLFSKDICEVSNLDLSCDTICSISFDLLSRSAIFIRFSSICLRRRVIFSLPGVSELARGIDKSPAEEDSKECGSSSMLEIPKSSETSSRCFDFDAFDFRFDNR